MSPPLHSPAGAVLALALGLATAGCNQTVAAGGNPEAAAAAAATPARSAGPKGVATALPKSAQACAEAAKRSADKQTEAALLGGALSMAGGLGGFGGQAGAIASHAASIGGSVVQQQAQAGARAEMEKECL